MRKSRNDLPFKGSKLTATPRQKVSVDIAFKQAQALHRAGQMSQAAAMYQDILRLQPAHFDTLNMFTILMLQCGRDEDAMQLSNRALQVNPAAAVAWVNRGHVSSSMRCFKDALANYDHALMLKPDLLEAHFNRGIVLRNLERNEEAVASYDRALQLRQNNPEVWNNRGESLKQLGRFEEALESFEKALKYKPGFAEAVYNRGNALFALGRNEEALASWEQAQTLKRDYAGAHYNEGLCRLLLGDYARGWEKYEWRRQCILKKHQRSFSQRLWLGGEEVDGKTILLHAEQGFGDTIQFCRYVRYVAALGAEVLLEVQPPLVTLLSTLEGPSRVMAKGAELPDFDFHTSLMSLPLACKAMLGTTIPGYTPYLAVPPDKMEVWRSELGSGEALRVGLVWCGSSTHVNDQNRSMRLIDFAPLLEIQQVTFVSLTKELRDHDRAQLAEWPQIAHYGERLHDFADTAALIDTLDLVITVDTAVAHLAGALGKPVWILLPHHPDWRWLLEIPESPWYPTAKLYRQSSAADWHSVVRSVAQDLFRLI